MSAPFSALAAVSVNFAVPVDSDIGLRYGAETQGLLLKSCGFKPARENKAKKNHRDFTVGYVFTNPILKLSLDAEVLQTAGTLAMLHPGEPVNKTAVQEFYADTDHGFNAAASGYFIADGIDTTANPGDLFQAKFELTWLPASPATNVNIVSAP